MIRQQLFNYGYVLDKLPNDLFEKVKIECEEARKTRYNLTENKKEEMISGLSRQGVPTHYYMSECSKELNKFTMEMAHRYENEFRYVSQLSITNINMGLINTPPWINIQQKGEYVPLHKHDGLLAYVIWVKIPYDSNIEKSSCFSFAYNNIVGGVMQHIIPINKQMEGMIVMFPASLFHQVYPFYTSDDVRISISGMIAYDGNNPTPNDTQKDMYKL
jgi:hypothetical protein